MLQKIDWFKSSLTLRSSGKSVSAPASWTCCLRSCLDTAESKVHDIVTRVPFRISCINFKSSAQLLKRTWRHFPPPVSLAIRVPADQLGRVPYAARQGPSTAATGSRRKSAFHPHQFQPLERPQETAETCRTSTAQSSGPRSPLQWWSWRPSARLVRPLWFSYTRGRKNQQGNLNRDQATLEQALKAWAEDTHGDSHRTFQQDRANWRCSGHTARHSKAARKICHFFITKDQWPPSSTDLKPIGYTMWSVLEKEAWSKPHKKIWSVNGRRSQKQSCVPPSETSQKVCCRCAGSRRPLWLAV